MKKVKKSKSSEIFLDFPIGHHILHDFNSLTILKKVRPDLELIIITKDLSATHILKKAGIKYTLIKDEKFLKKNILQKQDLLKNNTSFFEYLRYAVQDQARKLKEHINEKRNVTEKKSFPFIVIGFTLIASTILLFFIFYFAVHKTTIYMTPETEVIQVQKNFRFNNSTELSLDDNTIKLRSEKITVSLTDTFPSTDVDYATSQQAAGIITIYNELPSVQWLVEQTRFLSEDGIIYRLQEKITVPWSTLDDSWNLVLWEKNARVTADAFDINWYYSGTRANVSDVVLSVPWLTWDTKNKVYAKSAQLQWGTDEYDVVVWEEDLENAIKLLETKLKTQWLNDFWDQIKTKNKESSENYELLLVPNSISYTNFVYNPVKNVAVWDKLKNFEMSGSIEITWLVYNKDFVAWRLKSILAQKTLEEVQEIDFIDDSSVRIAHTLYSDISIDEVTQEMLADVKVTMELEAWVSKKLAKNGSYTIELLKNRILGLETKEAYDVMLNTSNISNVEIRNSPFFMKRITSKPENIIFKIKDS